MTLQNLIQEEKVNLSLTRYQIGLVLDAVDSLREMEEDAEGPDYDEGYLEAVVSLYEEIERQMKGGE